MNKQLLSNKKDHSRTNSLFAFLFFLLSFPAFAQTTYYWHGTTNTNWATATNWSTNTTTPSVSSAVPATTDNVVILNRTNLPTLDQARTVNNFTLTSGTLNLSTFALTINGTATFTAGAANNGSMVKTSTGTVIFGNASGGPTIGANINLKAGTLTFRNTTFNGTTTLEKTGTSNDVCVGNNTFNGVTSITKSGTTGTLSLQNVIRDIFNNDVTFTNGGTTAVQIAFNSDVNGATQFNGNLTLNNTNTGGITFGQGTTVTNSITGGTSTLASGKTLTIGTSGYISTGALNIRNFTQVGTGTTHTIALTGTTNLFTLNNCTFNGTVDFKAPQMVLTTNTFNGTATFEKSGATANASSGGNTFNGATTLKNSGSAIVTFANTTRDIFNNDLTLSASNTGGFQMAFNNSNATDGTLFNGNLTLNNTGTGSISFGMGTTVNGSVTGGTSSLASSKTLTIGTSGYVSTGALTLRNFTQVGSGTTHTIALTGTTNLFTLTSCTFNGTVDFKAPQMVLSTNTFNGISSFEKTGASANNSAGNNTFNNVTSITNSGSNSFVLRTYPY